MHYRQLRSVGASGCCEYMGYVDQNGNMRVKIECIVSEEEKQHSWNQLRIKHATDRYICVDPSGGGSRLAKHGITHVCHSPALGRHFNVYCVEEENFTFCENHI
jgi:hypothetical protein